MSDFKTTRRVLFYIFVGFYLERRLRFCIHLLDNAYLDPFIATDGCSHGHRHPALGVLTTRQNRIGLDIASQLGAAPQRALSTVIDDSI